MKTLPLSLLLVIFLSFPSFSQEQNYHHINTIFRNNGPRSSGGYGALGNKFTTINGEFANLAELYGGWYINHHFMIGLGAAAVTNNIPVALQYSALPKRMSYEYGQCGLMTEYVIGSDKAVHLAFQLFGGAGFTVQYERYGDDYSWDNHRRGPYDENWFFVAEPGVKLEVNIFRWMRFCPGISYRAAFDSKSIDLSDSDISGTSINLSLKFGKF